ncbi:MAG: BamA/TamA family outer membrane protein [Gammaproteobacteria bacterium]
MQTEEFAGSEDQIDVNYDVVEQNFGAISFQIGTGGGGDFFANISLQAQNFLGTGRTVGIGVNKSRFIKGLNFQFVDPYYTPDGVSRGFNLFAQEIDSPFNVSSFNTTSFGGSMSYSYPLSEIQSIGFDLGFTHTELSAGIGSVQEIIASPILFDNVNQYVVSPAQPNSFEGPVVDAVVGNVAGLSSLQLQKNLEPGFVDKFGDTFDNITLTGRWTHFALNRGQLATDGDYYAAGLEVTLPGSDLEYARLSFSSDNYWPLDPARRYVLHLRTALGYGIGYGDTSELPFFNHYFAGGLNSSGVVRGFEENSLGPESTAGAQYLTTRAVTLQRDENGEIARREDGSATGFNNDFAYQTTTLRDGNGNPILDANGNEQVALAVQTFFLDEDYDSFGGNILTTATLELLFPLPFVEGINNQLRTSFFIDAGNVFSSNCTERQKLLKNCTNFDLGEVRYSAGFSLTYISPFGPLTFYLAKPFGKEGDDTKTFDFTIGTGF